jgi:hypothetical protein
MEAPSRNFPVGTERNHDKTQSEYTYLIKVFLNVRQQNGGYMKSLFSFRFNSIA